MTPLLGDLYEGLPLLMAPESRKKEYERRYWLPGTGEKSTTALRLVFKIMLTFSRCRVARRKE